MVLWGREAIKQVLTAQPLDGRAAANTANINEVNSFIPQHADQWRPQWRRPAPLQEPGVGLLMEAVEKQGRGDPTGGPP